MRAAIYHTFCGQIQTEQVPDPTPGVGDVVVEIRANGICRSDWHGWQGHDRCIELPHVPGHECAGVIVAVGLEVARFVPGDRVIVPFSGGCGRCTQCAAGLQHICDDDFQPGFSAWGAFAQYCNIRYADLNLIKLPEAIDFVAAASLGCRFMTAFGCLVDRAKISPGETVVVFGCGGVGLSAIMIAEAVGAFVVAVDRRESALIRARAAGAHRTVRSTENIDVLIEEIISTTNGGANVTVDAIGSAAVVAAALGCLSKRGRHVQVGLMNADKEVAIIPMNKVVSHELTITGSHGLAVHRYPTLLDMIARDQINPGALVTSRVTLDESCEILMRMDETPPVGLAVIDRF